ncbi:MAG TPA: sigma-70 family RNA polymerase sigma factor [Natronosporangium sp.]
MDDRALVAALVSGDPRGLEGVYRTYADRLYTYCRGMLRDPDAAADAVHDTFVLASQRAGQLREPDRLRSWLYAIARNECLRQLRGRTRQVPLAEAGEVTAPEVDPVDGVRTAEIQELVWSAADGLNPGDREVFELAVRHELPAPEIGSLLGVSVAHAHARLSRARSQMERALGALLVARTGAEDCPELAQLLSGWNGKLTPLIRKRISRHIESCDLCGDRQRRQLAPAALFAVYASAPFLLVPAELWPRLELTCFDPGHAATQAAILRQAGAFEHGTGFPVPLDAARRKVHVLGTAAAAVVAMILLAAGAGAVLLPTEPAADQPQSLPSQVVAPPAGSPSDPATGGPTPTSTAPTGSASPSDPAAAGPPGGGGGAPPGGGGPPAGGGGEPGDPGGGAGQPFPPGSGPRSPTPPQSPGPSGPESSPSPAEPLTVVAEGRVECGLQILIPYGIVAAALASQPIDSATLMVRLSGGELRADSMSVAGPEAFGDIGPLFDRAGGEWWVVVTAGNQSAESEHFQFVRPCQPEPPR